METTSLNRLEHMFNRLEQRFRGWQSRAGAAGPARTDRHRQSRVIQNFKSSRNSSVTFFASILWEAVGQNVIDQELREDWGFRRPFGTFRTETSKTSHRHMMSLTNCTDMSKRCHRHIVFCRLALQPLLAAMQRHCPFRRQEGGRMSTRAPWGTCGEGTVSL